MDKFAIIVAGGSGTRMGNVLPKQFLLLNEKPILYFTIKSFLDAYEDMQVVLVLPEEFIKVGKEIVEQNFSQRSIQYAVGGETRFHSVRNGLQLVNQESIVFVHDAVRCMVTVDLIQRCYEQCMQTGTAIPVIPAKDSLRIISNDGTTSEPIERKNVVMVQTPQCFHSKIILSSFNIDYKEHFTDEATVVESFGIKVSLITGEDANIKITHPVDLLIAESILSK